MINTNRAIRQFSVTASTAFLVAVSGLAALAQSLTVTPDNPTGVYKTGDTVTWTAHWTDTANLPPAEHYVIKTGGATKVAEGDLNFVDNAATFTYTFTAPQTILIDVTTPTNPYAHIYAGAVADPFEIKPAAPPPADFDKFWKRETDIIKKTPLNPVLTIGDSGQTGIDYWKVQLDNINSTHVDGQLARPTTGDKFPAILQVQYAGVYGLQKQWVTGYAKMGYLAMNIEAHDIPIDQTPDYYNQLGAEGGALHYYWNIGNDDPTQSYYLQMYASCYQAVEYLAHRSDWNGKVLVVTGQSQGGQQSIALAGLHPKYITAVMVLVPAACDVMAPTIGRLPGFPSWYNNVNGKDPVKVRTAAQYFDPVNFAPKIKCPVLVAFGLHDEVLAPPSSVLSMVNNITSPKEVIILPNSGHQNVNGSQTAFYNRMYGAWLPALAQGKPAPVNIGN